MKNNTAGDYYLANDIDCSDTVNWNSGAGFAPGGIFTGTFDGQNHSITGLYINRPGEYAGLFSNLNSIAKIKNVNLIDVNIITGTMVGGLVGKNSGTITNSYATGSVTGKHYVGGLVGMNMGTITNSNATGSVTSNYYHAGGLVGWNEDMATITNSYATGSVTGSISAGGLVGTNVGTITNSYATGSVTSNAYVGGLVGANYYGDDDGIVTNSYYDTETSGQSDTGKGEPKTTVEMMTELTFVDWDFINIWGINEGVNYPYLQWQIMDADGDGIPDDEDNCPFEDATGFDANNDGCIDSLTGFSDIIETMHDDVLSDEIKNSMVSKIENALNSADKENDEAAVNMLEAFINQIEAQRGKKISE
jgi:hypothetical protein